MQLTSVLDILLTENLTRKLQRRSAIRRKVVECQLKKVDTYRVSVAAPEGPMDWL